jgi:hypothetical protein
MAFRSASRLLPIALVFVALSAPARGQRANHVRDIEAFFKHVDKTYPFFDLKGIRKDWARTKPALWKRARTCRTDADFLGIVYDAIKCLRDAHMYLRETKADPPKPEPRFYPGVCFLPAVKNRVAVMWADPAKYPALKTGTVVTRIDGKPARRFLEDLSKKAWAAGGYFSSPQRARLFEYRVPLEGRKGDKHVLHYLDGGKEKDVKVRCDTEVRGWAHTYNLPPGLQRVGRSFHWAKLESGVGYMYWRRIDASVWQGVPKALEACPDAKGWIVDIRGNGGGGYDETLIRQMKELPRPVAAILDAGAISAAETVARDLVNYAEARLFGEKTAGSSSSKDSWRFPSGVATVVYSTRSRSGIGGKIIEFNGVDPHVVVEAVPEELLEGKNSQILRAEEYLLGRRGK